MTVFTCHCSQQGRKALGGQSTLSREGDGGCSGDRSALSGETPVRLLPQGLSCEELRVTRAKLSLGLLAYVEARRRDLGRPRMSPGGDEGETASLIAAERYPSVGMLQRNAK